MASVAKDNARTDDRRYGDIQNNGSSGQPVRRWRLPWPIGHLRSLRVQLLLWTILPLAIALIVLSIAGVSRHRQAMQQLVEQRDRGLVLAEANTLARTIQVYSAQLAIAAGIPGSSADSALTADRERLITELSNIPLQALVLVNRQGDASALLGADTSWTESPTAHSVVEQAIATGQPQYSASDITGMRDTGQPAPGQTASSLWLAVPASHDRVLLGSIALDRLGVQEVGQQLQAETGGAVVILDRNGLPVYAGNQAANGLDLTAVSHATPLGNLQANGSGSSYLRLPGHDELLLTYARVDPPGWVVVNAEDMSQMSGAAMSIAEVLPMVLLFVAVLALLAISFGMAAIVRPLQELDHRAARVAWGEFDAVDQPVGGVQEIDDLRATLAQMASRIRSYQAGMRDYLSATTQAQEEERARLAHELHDDTVQALIALKQRAQMARNKALANDPERTAQRLNELTQLIDQELVSLRRLIADLRPIYLEDLGFVPALEMLAQQTRERHGLDVSLDIKGEPARMSSDLELTAFRIAQQALANVVSHAAAHQVRLETIFSPDSVTITIQDDGRGFSPPDQPADLARKGHFGLMGMRERAILYGGYLNVSSTPGRGTTITASLPACYTF